MLDKMVWITFEEYNAKYNQPKSLYYKIMDKYNLIKYRIKSAYLVLIGKSLAMSADECDYDDWDD